MTLITTVDAGPLVAFLNRADSHHAWAMAMLGQIPPPLLTCEAVLAEAWHLLGKASSGQRALLELLRRHTVRVAFDLEEHLSSIQKLVERYASVPMSLADACLVRMSELHADCRILTVDDDFHIYRRHGRQAVPLIIPDG